jgi:hypothetical protein
MAIKVSEKKEIIRKPEAFQINGTTFVYPFIGPTRCSEAITRLRGRMARGSQVASFLSELFTSKKRNIKPYADSIRRLLEDSVIWLPSKIFEKSCQVKDDKYKDGFYVENDFDGCMDSNPSEKFYTRLNRLEEDVSAGEVISGLRISKDGKVTFVPGKMVRFGKQNPSTLLRNGLITTIYGVEGTKQLASLARILGVSIRVHNNPRGYSGMACLGIGRRSLNFYILPKYVEEDNLSGSVADKFRQADVTHKGGYISSTRRIYTRGYAIAVKYTS